MQSCNNGKLLVVLPAEFPQLVLLNVMSLFALCTDLTICESLLYLLHLRWYVLTSRLQRTYTTLGRF